MNLYVLFAIALGAISGFSEPSVAPRAFARVVDVRGTRAGRRAIAATRIVFTRGASAKAVRAPLPFSLNRIEAPLTGSASPRAPAI
jgi:hypothetical protein